MICRTISPSVGNLVFQHHLHHITNIFFSTRFPSLSGKVHPKHFNGKVREIQRLIIPLPAFDVFVFHLPSSRYSTTSLLPLPSNFSPVGLFTLTWHPPPLFAAFVTWHRSRDYFSPMRSGEKVNNFGQTSTGSIRGQRSEWNLSSSTAFRHWFNREMDGIHIFVEEFDNFFGTLKFFAGFWGFMRMR